MLNAIRIGPRGAPFPHELWQGVFEQTATLDDAMCWASACGERPSDHAYRNLLRLHAPALLEVLPKPSAAKLFPGAKGPRPDLPVPIFNLHALCPTFFSNDNPLPRDTAQCSALFHAASFMMGFAEESSLTVEIVDLAHCAWTRCYADEELDEGAYRSRCGSVVLFEAWQNKTSCVPLWLGYGAKLPPFYRGLNALHTLQLFDIDAPLDLQPLQKLSTLHKVELGAGTTPEVVNWVKEALGHWCPKVCVTQLDSLQAMPSMPARHRSETWIDVRRKV